MENAKLIWDILEKEGFNDFGKAGVLANIRAESAMRPNNAQDSGNRRLNMTDEAYTAAVDNGTYTNFVRDAIGYGLCQWTYWSRKKALLDFAKQYGRSVGDLGMQIAYMIREFRSYGILDKLKTSASVYDATKCMMLEFEKPANQSEANVRARVRYGQGFYEQYAKPSLDTDLKKLVSAGVIKTPEYWKQTAPTVKYLPELIHNMAAVL